jgi:hypothetical protein
VLLAINDLLLFLIRSYASSGKEISFMFSIFFYGDYIARMATPERCERHKAMKSESLIALGLLYTLTSMALDNALEATTGMPPYIYLRSLRHLLLLLHINLAAHTPLPLVKPGNSFTLDPFILYQYATRFIVDVVFAGLINRIPLDFAPPPGAKPFLPLSTLLVYLQKVLDSDLEQVHVSKPGFFKQASSYLVPKLFQNPKNAVNDSVIKFFWPNIQQSGLYIIKIVEKKGKTIVPLTTGPKIISAPVKFTLPAAVYYKLGLPIKLSEFLISLSKKEDFWNFVTALKQWLERNNVSYEVVLAKKSSKSGLYELKKVITLPPEAQNNTPLPPAEQLQPYHSLSGASPSIKPPQITAHKLFSQKQRPPIHSSSEPLFIDKSL